MAKFIFFACLALGLLMGCTQETRYRVLSFFFDGVPKPGEERPVKKPEQKGRTMAQSPGVAEQIGPKTEGVFPAEPSRRLVAAEGSTRWEDIEPILPKDARGDIDWMKALDDGVIEPRGSLDPAAPELEVLALDLELIPEEMPEYRAVFRHESHTRWDACGGCHEKVFTMEKGAAQITMEKILAGEYCGLCHGTVAFSIEPNCARCHPKIGGESAEPKVIEAVEGRVYGDIVFDRKVDLSGLPAAVFPHWVHRIRFRCNVCHPAIFEAKRGANPITMEAMGAGKSCAICHNGKVAWGVSFESCQRCHIAQNTARP